MRQGLLILFFIFPFAAQGAENLAPFKPRGAKELQELPPQKSKEEGVFLVSEMFDLFAVEVDWKYKDSELTQLFKNAKPACMMPISKYPPAYFAEDAKIVYVDRDFKKGTERTVAACANYVVESFKQGDIADKFEGKVRTTLSIEDLMAFQQNAEFMKKLKAEYPNNIFAKYSFATLAAGKNLGEGGAPLAIQMGTPAAVQSQTPDQNSWGALFGVLFFALILAVTYLVRSKKQTPNK